MNALGKACCQFWHSSIGKKIVVAVTGLMLVGFLIGHVAGNLLMFQGRDAMNGYAQFLHHFAHGWGIWFARIGLLAAFVLHIVATVALVRRNRAARASRYECDATVQASRGSRIMIWSGLTILAFLVFHILHFTVRIDPGLASLQDADYAAAHGGEARHDTFAMVMRGFQNPLVSLFYIVGVTLLCSHLSHGVASIFQTLGLRGKHSERAIQRLGWVVAIAIWAGFLSVPVTIVTRLKKDAGAAATTAVSPRAPATARR